MQLSVMNKHVDTNVKYLCWIAKLLGKNKKHKRDPGGTDDENDNSSD